MIIHIWVEELPNKAEAAEEPTKDYEPRKAKKLIEEFGMKLKKTNRVHEQRSKWSKLENEGRKTDPQWK